MAKTLDKRINCSWSIKRLTQEHDKWSEEMTDILFTHNNRNLNIAKIFKDFAKESGYNIIKDVKNLNLEGKKMGHCVASYVSKIESCKCAIFHVNDYTLELIKEYYPDSDSRLIIGQFSGKHNIKIPSKELTKEVKTALDKFNEKNKLRKYSTHVTEESWDW
jgi:ABC-type oligopeptide transport system ATPase subunit